MGPSICRLAKLASIRCLDDAESLPPTISAIAGKLDVMVKMEGVIDL